MNTETANAIWDVLMRTCGASESLRSEFLYAIEHGPRVEFRFIGNLGFGKFYWNGRQVRVTCYSEHLTPARELMITRAIEEIGEVMKPMSATK